MIIIDAINVSWCVYFIVDHLPFILYKSIFYLKFYQNKVFFLTKKIVSKDNFNSRIFKKIPDTFRLHEINTQKI